MWTATVTPQPKLLHRAGFDGALSASQRAFSVRPRLLCALVPDRGEQTVRATHCNLPAGGLAPLRASAYYDQTWNATTRKVGNNAAFGKYSRTTVATGINTHDTATTPHMS
jgi:hypothetical protein